MCLAAGRPHGGAGEFGLHAISTRPSSDARLHLRLIGAVAQCCSRIARNYTTAQEPFRTSFHVIRIGGEVSMRGSFGALTVCNGQHKK